jgi:antitoxin component YwqK of YwqJK toxin-antitoxin module
MWNNLRKIAWKRIAITGAILAAAVAVAVMVLLWSQQSPQRSQQQSPLPSTMQELTRAELDLHDGVLYTKGGDTPFNGKLIEDDGQNKRKLEIRIRNGKADGLSRGWFENGQLETEENFVAGVSHGIRTRWFPNGTQKSEATIVDGQVNGRYVEWYDNGKKAAEAVMVDGKAHGLAESWYPSGKIKSRIQLENGTPTNQQFFEENVSTAQLNKHFNPTSP